MQNNEIKMGRESMEHKILKREGMEILKERGYSNIQMEYRIENKPIDVVGFREDGVGVVECGIFPKNRREGLEKNPEIIEIIHLPYNKDKIIRPTTLEIDKDIWNKFKDLVHRDKRLTDAIALLVHEFVDKGNRTIDLRKAK